MNTTIENKLDAYLALAFQLKRKNSAGLGEQIQLPENFDHLSALSDEVISKLHKRAKGINMLSITQRNVWFALWKERLRRKGVTKRLDPNVHPEHVAVALADEPQSVRLIIEGHLPDELAGKVAVFLKSRSLYSFAKKERHERDMPLVDDRLLRVVRRKFLRRFVASEDLFDEVEYDIYSTRELGNVLWNLGLREIAIVCRGLKRMENIAAFLRRFEEETAKNIGALISALEEVSAERVKIAESRVKLAFEEEEVSDARVRNVGMRIFAEALSYRSKDAIRFNLQKLPVVMSERIDALVVENRAVGAGERSVVGEILEMAAHIVKGGGR